jgi:hypothetical protein
MTRRRTLAIAVVVLVAALFGWLRLATRHTPAGQPPLVTLDRASVEALRSEFNGAARQVRLILLLSPT